MKTIFYKLIKDENLADYWFDSTPAKEWFTLDSFLYEPNGNIKRETIVERRDEGNVYSNLSVNKCEDFFTDEGIVRRIGLYSHYF